MEPNREAVKQIVQQRLLTEMHLNTVKEFLLNIETAVKIYGEIIFQQNELLWSCQYLQRLSKKYHYLSINKLPKTDKIRFW